MGAGIAQLSAAAGFDTILYDVRPEALDGAKAAIDHRLSVALDKGKLTADEKEIIEKKIHFTSGINDCRAGLMIEAILEKEEAKTELLNRLMELNGKETIYASNTSSLSITAMARGTRYPHRVAGMHFFNPAPAMPLVEIVSGPLTAEEIKNMLGEIALRMRKTPVLVKDSPGFIVNRVARHFYLEAMRIVEDGVAGYETVDTLMEASGFRMGPFALSDLVGQDINFAVTESLYRAFHGEPRFRPSRLQEEKVLAGQLGRKTGKGFYAYPATGV